MRFEATRLKGVFIVALDKKEDERGFFARTFCRNEFSDQHLVTDFVQCNLAFNRAKGTLRGMHYQVPPHGEAKLVRCTAGAVFDVVIDLRPDSTTRLEWLGIELSADNRRQLYIPEGLAHGYLTLVENTELFYQVSQFYTPHSERGIRYNDPLFAIDWPEPTPLIASEKDRSWPDFTPDTIVASG